MFDNFEHLVLGLWGDAVQILVDPYVGGTAGTIRIYAWLDADVVVTRPAAFSVAKGLLTT